MGFVTIDSPQLTSCTFVFKPLVQKKTHKTVVLLFSL